MTLLLLALAGKAAADETIANLPEALRDQFLETGEISRYFHGADRPTLAPQSEFSAELTRELDSFAANIGVEVLFRRDQHGSDTDMTATANTLLSFSRLEGTEYYSASRDSMRLLFERSYTTDLSDARPRLSDPAIESLPAVRSVYLFQRDLTFGENLYSATLYADDHVVHLALENLTPYRYGPFRIIKPGEMRLEIFVLKAEDALYYYGVFGARSISFPLLEKRIHTSFYNRLAALYSWFDAVS